MRPLLTLTLTAMLLLTASARSEAQTGPQPSVPRGAAPVDIGANLSGLFASGAAGAVVGPAVTMNFTDRHALQVRTDLNLSRDEHSWSLDGLYSVLYQFTFVDRSDVRSFLSVGMGGGIEAAHGDAYSYTAPAYTLITGGIKKEIPETTRTIPSYSRFRLSYPIIGVVGIGSDIRLARRLSLHLQGDLGINDYGLGVRASAGLTVPLGHMTR